MGGELKAQRSMHPRGQSGSYTIRFDTLGAKFIKTRGGKFRNIKVTIEVRSEHGNVDHAAFVRVDGSLHYSNDKNP